MANQLDEWLASSPWANPEAELPVCQDRQRPALKLA